MKIPKRFKLASAAASKARPETGLHLDCVHLNAGRLIASNGQGAAVVPILDSQDRPGSDLPRMEPGEEISSRRLPLQAIKEATKGKVGIGTLRPAEESTEAQSADGKQWIRVDTPAPAGDVPNFDAALELTETTAPSTHRYVEVALDAQLLAGIAQAIGAEEGVRLRFLVSKETGRADGEAHGAVDVRPLREDDGGRGILMIQVVQPML